MRLKKRENGKLIPWVFRPLFSNKMLSTTTNYYITQNKGQGFPLSPPPLKPRKRKAPENCFRSYIDQVADGFYHASKLIRNTPQTNRDTYFVIKTRATSVGSYRRNYSHRSVALFKTKKLGSTRANIEYLLCNFVELDGSSDNTLKTKEDVLALIEQKNLPTASYVVQTSPGRFHIVWTYNNPLPWTTKGESYWASQQKRLIKLFEQGGFLVDKGASMNPCQNLRNPSQLTPFNFKRMCRVEIHKTFKKTSLRLIYKALNGTNIPNPKRLPASVKLRRYLRANKTFTLTLAELAGTLGIALSTAERIVKRAIANGDMFTDAKVGNNKRFVRTTRYRSGLYLEPQFSEPSHSSSKTILSGSRALLGRFRLVGAEKGRRNRTIFALGLFLKAQLGKGACIEAIRGELLQGARACHVREREFERILKSIMKPAYSNPFSLAKMREWGLIEETKHLH